MESSVRRKRAGPVVQLTDRVSLPGHFLDGPGVSPSEVLFHELKHKEQDVGSSSGSRALSVPGRPLLPVGHVSTRCPTKKRLLSAAFGLRWRLRLRWGACPLRFLGPERAVFFRAGCAASFLVWFHGRSTTSCTSSSTVPGVTSLCGAHRRCGSSSRRSTHSICWSLSSASTRMVVMEADACSSCSRVSSECLANASAMKCSPSVAHLTSAISADRLIAWPFPRGEWCGRTSTMRPSPKGKRSPALSAARFLPRHYRPCFTRCRRCSASAKRTADVILRVSVEASSFLTALSMAFTPFPPD